MNDLNMLLSCFGEKMSDDIPARGGVADNLADGVGAALVELCAGVAALAAEARRGQVAVVVEVAPVHALHRPPRRRRVGHADLQWHVNFNRPLNN